MVTICQKCGHRTSTISGIVDGVYYSRLCKSCHAQMMTGQRPSSGEANYNRGRDYEDHMADIVQPYVDGNPNPDFIKAYPEKSLELFGVDRMRQYS